MDAPAHGTRKTLEEYIAFASKVAKRLWDDPEAESIANEAAWRAYSSYREPTLKWGNYTEEGWIAMHVTQGIQGEWRKLHCTKKRSNERTDGWWESVVCTYDPEPSDFECSPADWQILCEKYIDGWAWDVVAKRYCITVAGAKRRVKEALSRFVRAFPTEDFVGYALSLAMEK